MTDPEIYEFELAAEEVCWLAMRGNKYALRKLARVTVQLAQSMDELMKKDAPEHKAALECWRPILCPAASIGPAPRRVRRRRAGVREAVGELRSRECGE